MNNLFKIVDDENTGGNKRKVAGPLREPAFPSFLKRKKRKRDIPPLHTQSLLFFGGEKKEKGRGLRPYSPMLLPFTKQKDTPLSFLFVIIVCVYRLSFIVCIRISSLSRSDKGMI